MHKIIRIRGLDCANCAAELSEELERIEGVTSASADFVTQRVDLEYEGEKTLEKCVYAISHFEEVEIADGSAEKKESRLKEILSIAISAALFVPALVLELLGFSVPSLVLFLLSFAAAGWQVIFSAGKNAVKAFSGGFHPSVLLDENILMLIAAVGAIAIGEYMESAAVVLLYEIGELLQSVAVGSSRSAIRKLMELKSDTAILIEGETRREVEAEALKAGDLILLRKGDKLPADCELLEGETQLDTKSLTGESVPRDVKAGGEMLAGCVNAGGAVKAKVLRPSSESAVQKVLDLVENSSSRKARPEKFITRFARVYTPVVVLCALLVALVPPLFTGFDFVRWITPAIEFLVISCPCALIISVPLTYFSGVGSLARCGVLAKGAVYLDELAKVKVAVFDKTGTLTEGKFHVSRVVGGDRVLDLAASAEKNSSHPLAEAFADMGTLEAKNVQEIAGMGISCEIEGKVTLVGGLRLMRENGIAADEADARGAVVYVAQEGTLLGYVEIDDRVRADAADALKGLKEGGVECVAVLTGDTRERAEEALSGLPVDEIRAGLLPGEKVGCAEELKTRGPLLYAGDGINDTPVMTVSDVSFAMGGLGSDAAIEASDFVLAGDSLSALPKALRCAKKTKRIVRENIVFSIAVKLFLMAASVVATASGLFALPIWAAVFGDVGVMLLAVLNSMRMRAKL